ncbi:hypothetical protein [Mucilaginibacter sp. L3T2-6]|uniref:hypothetical protein n=1 Tax=Mucilaginibacter sp. L3T2-6 TaxID=3062491 RepID=UPI002677519B|nr:hypothetical protein [Mucilaginibacter sp. L3T2-6]MDO3642253.1 hypothetical protein [Mucilaginibacter sp. L3T2-6]MDV6214748.1 hypothetical protein [Mucilaginibacter sp. L3T2-6]
MKKNTGKLILKELINNKGFLPVSIDWVNNKITWIDFGQYHFYEGFFHKSASIFSNLKKGNVDTLVTDINILTEEALVADSLYPTGFIFHAGRCGSTILSKALARSRENHVISEAGPMNTMWRLFVQKDDQPINVSEFNKKIYKHLLLAMGRQRSILHKHFFIKFTSFNILFFDFIHAVFPGVPAIFMTRNTEDILRSFDKRRPGWLLPEAARVLNMIKEGEEPDEKKIIDSFFDAAGKYPDDILRPIAYGDLKPEILPAVLKYFRVDTSCEQLALMQSQFLFDSKVEFNRKKFGSN